MARMDGFMGFTAPGTEIRWGWQAHSMTFSFEDLEQRFITVVKIQPRLVTAHAKVFTHALGPLIHALGERRQHYRIGDDEFAPEGDYIMEYPADSAELAKRTSEAARLVRVCRTR